MTKKAVETRGYRNNNAGNIKKGESWQGMADSQTDPVFIVFKSPEYGYRAMTKVLMNYQRLHGLSTVRQIITRYAPASDNNHTDNYIAFIAKKIGVPADQPINVKNHIFGMVKAVAEFENGYIKHSDSVIYSGVEMGLA